MTLVYSRLCNRDSARADVFARSARSFVKSLSVNVSVRYHLLLFFSVKPFSFFGLTDIHSKCYGPGRGHKENRTPRL